MGYELTYQASLRGTTVDQLDSEIEDNIGYLERIEQDIFALICMDPSKVRPPKKKSDEGDDDCSWMDNAEYLAHRWNELKEQWRETHDKLTSCQSAKYAVEDKVRHVSLCPDCMVEIEGGYNYETHQFEQKCPKCGKLFKPRYYMENSEAEQDNGPFAVEAEVKTFHESC